MTTDYERENGGKLATGFALTIAANCAAVQNAPVKLSLARHFNLTGTQNVLQHDQARVCQLKARATGKSFASSPDEAIT
jgi:hypothetical protein